MRVCDICHENAADKVIKLPVIDKAPPCFENFEECDICRSCYKMLVDMVDRAIRNLKQSNRRGGYEGL